MAANSTSPKKRILLKQLNRLLYRFSLNPSKVNNNALIDLTGEAELSDIFERTLHLVESTKSIKSLEQLQGTIALLDELYHQNPYHMLNEKVQKQAHISWISRIKETINSRLQELVKMAPAKRSKSEQTSNMFKLCCVQFYRKMLKHDIDSEILIPYYINLIQNQSFIDDVRKFNSYSCDDGRDDRFIEDLLNLQDKYLPTETHQNQLTMFMLVIIATAQSPNFLECLQSTAVESLHNEAFSNAKQLINAGLNALQIIIEKGSPKILRKP